MDTTWLFVIMMMIIKLCFLQLKAQQLGGVLFSKIWIDKDGNVAPSEDPGLGVLLNEKMIGKYAA